MDAHGSLVVELVCSLTLHLASRLHYISLCKFTLDVQRVCTLVELLLFPGTFSGVYIPSHCQSSYHNYNDSVFPKNWWYSALTLFH